MANLKPSDHRPYPAAPATTRTRRLPWAPVGVLVGLSVNLGFAVRRGRDRAEVAFVAFSHLNLLLLFCAIRRFDLSPPGSAARGRARLAVWLLTTTLTAAFTGKMGALLPLPFAIAAWVMAAATVGGGFYLLFAHEDK